MPSIREALGEAFEESTEAMQPEAVADAAQPMDEVPLETSAPVQGTAEEVSARTRDEQGRFARAQKEAAAKQAAPPEPSVGKPPSVLKPAAAVAPAAQPAAAATAPAKAPATWKATAREAWAQVPPAAQEEIRRREAEIDRALKETATARQQAEQWDRTITPYRAFLTGEPTQAVQNLLQTAVALRTGDKEAVVAQIIKGYGVNVERLASLLDGNGAAPPEQRPPEQFRDPRLDQLISHLQNTQKQRQQETHAKLAKEVQDFAASHEFFEDVKPRMRALIQAHHDMTGQDMPLEEAYEQACQLDKDVRPLWEQRKQAQLAASAHAPTQRARTTPSLRNEPTATGSKARPTSTREALLANWDEAAQR